MKIAIIHAADYGGGAERSTLTLHKGLLELGHDSWLYVGYKYLDETNVAEIERVRTLPGLLRLTHWAEQTLGWQHLYAPGFRNLVRQIDSNTEVVHLHSLWGSAGYADLGALPMLASKFPTVMTLRDEWMFSGHCACAFDCEGWRTGCGHCPDLGIPPAINRDGTRFNWRRKRRLIAATNLRVTTVSDWLRKRVKDSPIFKNKPVSVIFNAINEQVFKPSAKEKARNRMELPQNRFIVLLAGQTIEGINQGIAQQAVEAINGIRDRRLLPLLVGHSAKLVAATINRPCVTLPFQREPTDIACCYQAADLTLVSSEVETFGRIAAESQACGTPVVTFASGGLPEVVQDGVGGFVINRFDIGAYSAAIQLLIGDKQRMQSMKQAAIESAMSRFANPLITRAYLSEYEKAVDERMNKIS